jgi:uroporphyrinogen-III decarboxylase
VRRLKEVVGSEGGLVLASSHDMPGDIPLENMLALVEASREP